MLAGSTRRDASEKQALKLQGRSYQNRSFVEVQLRNNLSDQLERGVVVRLKEKVDRPEVEKNKFNVRKSAKKCALASVYQVRGAGWSKVKS